jgi:putative DNA methylase
VTTEYSRSSANAVVPATFGPERTDMGKKLIEVAPFLPLDAISTASKADKDKKTGTIRNVHKWFAPMPTPAVRALIFAAVVDDPGNEAEREGLLDLVKRLVPPDGNPPDEATLEDARAVIRKSTGESLPTIFDPFCGGGSTLIEAQRLGLPAIGSDLNPVPVLITRTLTELIPQVAGRPPLAGNSGRLGSISGSGLDGLFADVKHYAEIARTEVWDKVGHLYPRGPTGETIIAWLWARTVVCENPACGRIVPLVSNTWVSKKKVDRRWYALEPTPNGIRIDIKTSGGGPALIETVNRSGATCPACSTSMKFSYVRDQGRQQRMGLQVLASATDGTSGRSFLTADSTPVPSVNADAPDIGIELNGNPRDLKTPNYGLKTLADQFTDRQLVMLEAFAEAIAKVPDRVRAGGGDEIYATTVASILGLALGKLAQSNSTQVRWKIDSRNGSAKPEPAFGRHALPMVWDFAEANPFGGSVGDWMGQIDSILRGVAKLPAEAPGAVVQRADARTTARSIDRPVVIVTDPPYFDQIGYADLSDFFYVWHRRALRSVHPDLYRTIVTPKDDELIATPYRHNGNKGDATKHFVDGFTETFRSLSTVASPNNPIVIVYAHRQEETTGLGSASTGWDAMLEAVLAADLTIEGTLPIRGTSSSRQIGQGTNSLASYMVMVCRPRTAPGRPASIADFRARLRARLPQAVDTLLATGESMVDIRHAAIGPGMEVFSEFATVFDGTEPIRVRRALSIINEELGRLLDEHLGPVDDETRWACHWFADRAYERGDYDDGRKLAQVFGLGVNGLVAAGIVESGRNQVRLLPRTELPAKWLGDSRAPLWEATQHLVKRLTEGASAGEQPAAELLAALGEKAAGARELAQYLANLAIEKGWSDDAVAFDALVRSWPRIEQLASGQRVDSAALF